MSTSESFVRLPDGSIFKVTGRGTVNDRPVLFFPDQTWAYESICRYAPGPPSGGKAPNPVETFQRRMLRMALREHVLKWTSLDLVIEEVGEKYLEVIMGDASEASKRTFRSMVQDLLRDFTRHLHSLTVRHFAPHLLPREGVADSFPTPPEPPGAGVNRGGVEQTPETPKPAGAPSPAMGGMQGENRNSLPPGAEEWVPSGQPAGRPPAPSAPIPGLRGRLPAPDTHGRYLFKDGCLIAPWHTVSINCVPLAVPAGEPMGPTRWMARWANGTPLLDEWGRRPAGFASVLDAAAALAAGGEGPAVE